TGGYHSEFPVKLLRRIGGNDPHTRRARRRDAEQTRTKRSSRGWFVPSRLEAGELPGDTDDRPENPPLQAPMTASTRHRQALVRTVRPTTGADSRETLLADIWI